MSEGKKAHRITSSAHEKSVRESNIVAAKAVADAVRTSLGPRGMDKMISSPKGEVVITNDGATILKQMEVSHPTAKMLVDLSKSQDIEAGDGTTTVTVIAGALLNAAQTLLEKGIHPTVISESFLMAAKKSEEILQAMSVPVDLADREQLIRAASTSLNSKVISNNAGLLAPLAVDAILKIIDPATAVNCDLRDIKVVKKMGGTIDDTELVDGLVFAQKASHAAGGPTKIANAKIGLVQFCLSAPKTDIEQNIVVSDYSQMDRILKEERKYILDMCKKIQKSGCNVLLIQKSILRDAVNDLSLHFLAKMKILVVKVSARPRRFPAPFPPPARRRPPPPSLPPLHPFDPPHPLPLLTPSPRTSSATRSSSSRRRAAACRSPTSTRSTRRSSARPTSSRRCRRATAASSR